MAEDTERVPLVDLRRQYADVAAPADQAALRVLSGCRYILGPEVEAFEAEFASYLGVKHGVGVASGTDALVLALKALGVGPGDEVITTDFTFIATAEAISECGATPVFADIDPRTFNLDPRSASERISGRTRAILVVHLFGQPADMDRLSALARQNGLLLVEDCAQSHGATWRGRKAGSFGDASAFSFFPTKPLGGAGDGGMVCTNNDEIAGKVRILRAHGSRKKYISEVLGTNSRLDELQAAVLRVKLRRLEDWNRSRREVAREYDRRLKGIRVPPVAEQAAHVYHQYTIRSGDRDALRHWLEKEGVGCNVYFPLPLHLQPCYAHLGYTEGEFPASELASREVLSLPIFVGMTPGEISRVCEAVNRFSGH